MKTDTYAKKVKLLCANQLDISRKNRVIAYIIISIIFPNLVSTSTWLQPVAFQRRFQKHLTKNVLAVVRDLRLLSRIAMILKGKNYRIVRGLKRTLCYSFQHLFG